MKKRFPLAAIIAAIIIVFFDAFVLIFMRTYTAIRIFGLAMATAAFLAYILCKFLVKKPAGERGMVLLDATLLFYAILMLIMAIIALLLPKTAFIGFLVVNCLLLGLLAILIVIAVYQKVHIGSIDKENKNMLSDQDLLDTIDQIIKVVKDQSVVNAITNVKAQIEEQNITIDSIKGQKIKEYVGFMYRDAISGNLNNVIYNLKNVEKIVKE